MKSPADHELFEQLSQKAYDTACARGQYHMLPLLASNPSAGMNNSRMVMNGISHLIEESYEVEDAYRKRHRCSPDELHDLLAHLTILDTEAFQETYENKLHNSIDDELADVVINTLSLWKAMRRDGSDISNIINCKMKYNTLRKD